MAEGWLRYLKGERYEAYSAGVEAHGLKQNAVYVMAEAGVDISGHKSKFISEFDGIEFDIVVTVCANADKRCPTVLKGKVMHVPFPDPPRLAESLSEKEEILDCYRTVRDEIRDWIEANL